MATKPPNPALEALDVLVGEWTVEVPQFGDAQGRVTIDW